MTTFQFCLSFLLLFNFNFCLCQDDQSTENVLLALEDDLLQLADSNDDITDNAEVIEDVEQLFGLTNTTSGEYKESLSTIVPNDDDKSSILEDVEKLLSNDLETTITTIADTSTTSLPKLLIDDSNQITTTNYFTNNADKLTTNSPEEKIQFTSTTIPAEETTASDESTTPTHAEFSNEKSTRNNQFEATESTTSANKEGTENQESESTTESIQTTTSIPAETTSSSTPTTTAQPNSTILPETETNALETSQTVQEVEANPVITAINVVTESSTVDAASSQELTTEITTQSTTTISQETAQIQEIFNNAMTENTESETISNGSDDLTTEIFDVTQESTTELANDRMTTTEESENVQEESTTTTEKDSTTKTQKYLVTTTENDSITTTQNESITTTQRDSTTTEAAIETVPTTESALTGTIINVESNGKLSLDDDFTEIIRDADLSTTTIKGIEEDRKVSFVNQLEDEIEETSSITTTAAPATETADDNVEVVTEIKEILIEKIEIIEEITVLKPKKHHVAADDGTTTTTTKDKLRTTKIDEEITTPSVLLTELKALKEVVVEALEAIKTTAKTPSPTTTVGIDDDAETTTTGVQIKEETTTEDDGNNETIAENITDSDLLQTSTAMPEMETTEMKTTEMLTTDIAPTEAVTTEMATKETVTEEDALVTDAAETIPTGDQIQNESMVVVKVVSNDSEGIASTIDTISITESQTDSDKTLEEDVRVIETITEIDIKESDYEAATISHDDEYNRSENTEQPSEDVVTESNENAGIDVDKDVTTVADDVDVTLNTVMPELQEKHAVITELFAEKTTIAPQVEQKVSPNVSQINHEITTSAPEREIIISSAEKHEQHNDGIYKQILDILATERNDVRVTFPLRPDDNVDNFLEHQPERIPAIIPLQQSDSMEMFMPPAYNNENIIIENDEDFLGSTDRFRHYDNKDKNDNQENNDGEEDNTAEEEEEDDIFEDESVKDLTYIERSFNFQDQITLTINFSCVVRYKGDVYKMPADANITRLNELFDLVLSIKWSTPLGLNETQENNVTIHTYNDFRSFHLDTVNVHVRHINETAEGTSNKLNMEKVPFGGTFVLHNFRRQLHPDVIVEFRYISIHCTLQKGKVTNYATEKVIVAQSMPIIGILGITGGCLLILMALFVFIYKRYKSNVLKITLE